MTTNRNDFAVEMKNVSKAYGATVALENVSLSIAPGEIQALLGENGAGKSTLVKILSGVVQPDEGSLALVGAVYAPKTIVEARRHGVATAFQELSLVPNLTVAQNFFMPHSLRGKSGLTSMRRMTDVAAEILADHDLPGISPTAKIESLSLADRQRIEIVRAMNFRPKLLILDEPTGALADVEWLYRLVRSLKSKNTAVLYISHRLAEIRALAQRATIMRNGRSVETVSLADADDSSIFEMMVGHSANDDGRRRSIPNLSKAPRALTAVDLAGDRLKHASLEVKKGEIVGIAALEGQGQRELFRMLAGVSRPATGQIFVGEQVADYRSPRDALRTAEGVAFVPEERKTEGIFPGQKSRNNITISVLSKLAKMGVVGYARERNAVREPATQVELNERYLSFKIENLSGGNQQKAIIARALLTGASNLLLFDPTRGVDVGTKQTIYRAIRKHADNGGSVLIYSSELPELLSLTDRCLVIYGGQIVADLSSSEMNEPLLVAYMTGHHHDNVALN